MEHKSNIELVHCMQNGDDEQAFIEVYKRYHNSLYLLAYRMTNSDADAQDMVQETFIQVRKSIHTLQDPHMFSSWIKRILFNKCKNMFRKNRDCYMNDEMLASLNHKERNRNYLPNEQMRHASTQEILLECIHKIPLIYQAPLLLKYYGEETMQEIGVELQIPTGTVKSRLRTAKRLLKEEIASYESIYQTKVDFNANVLGSTITLALLAKALRSKLMAFTSTPAFAPLAIVAMVAGGSVIVPKLMESMQHDKVKMEQVLPQNAIQTIHTDEDAYFALRNWAHDKQDITSKSTSDIQRVVSYYDLLKRNEGVYWDLLQQDEWAATFVNHKDK